MFNITQNSDSEFNRYHDKLKRTKKLKLQNSLVNVYKSYSCSEAVNPNRKKYKSLKLLPKHKLFKNSVQSFPYKSIDVSKKYKQLGNQSVSNENHNKLNKVNNQKQSIIISLRQKIRLFHQLKSMVEAEDNNWLSKKILFQIKYLGAAKIILHLWDHSVEYIGLNISEMQQLEKWGNFIVDQNFLKALNTVNNICKFLLMEHRQKIWKQRQHQLLKFTDKNMTSINNIESKLHRISQKNVRTQLNKTILNLQKQKTSYVNKPHYYDLKSKGSQFLMKQEHGCKILKAEIFSENFYNTGPITLKNAQLLKNRKKQPKFF